MARPQAADYDDRRRAILAAAADLYAQRGFHGCSIADLARACGMSKSLLYHYFSSKEDILFEVMQGHVADLKTVVDETAQISDAKARFHARVTAFMQLYRDAASQHKVLVNDLDKLPPARRSEIVTSEREIVDAIAQTIGEISPQLAAQSERLRAATMLFFGMINWTHTWYKPGKGIATDDLATMIETLYLKGVEGAV